MQPRPRWRLLVTDGLDGAGNMALDEALLRSMDAELLAGGSPVPLLRLYDWRPAAVSTGRHQELAAACDLGACEAEGVDVVRRPTGGRGVLHDREVTFAVVAPCTGRFEGAGVTQAAAALSQALVAGLRRLGVDASTERGAPAQSPRAGREACFAATARSEVVVGGRKLCGSAQFRGQLAFLQHGSLPLVFDAERQARLLGSRAELLARKACGLAEALGREPGRAEVETALVSGFEEVFGVALEPSGLLEAEHAAWRARDEALRADAERFHRSAAPSGSRA